MVVKSSLEEEKAADLTAAKGVEILRALGVYADVERASAGTHIRAGRGKLRGRKYRTPRSVLVVTMKFDGVSRAFRNLPGGEGVSPSGLNAAGLAPGREACDHQAPQGVPGGGRRDEDRGVLMGKNLPQQRRGRGTSPTYRSPSHRHPGIPSHPKLTGEGTIISLEHAPGRTAPIARVRYGRLEVLMIAPDGLQVGQVVSVGGYNIDRGNTLPLGSIPEGTLVYNIESKPGDGGKFVRAAGTAATGARHTERDALQVPERHAR